MWVGAREKADPLTSGGRTVNVVSARVPPPLSIRKHNFEPIKTGLVIVAERGRITSRRGREGRAVVVWSQPVRLMFLRFDMMMVS